MKLKTVTIFSSVLIGILFSTLTISYLNTSKVLDLQARELSNTEKQISAAKGLKVALLQHNRSVFLFSLNKKHSITKVKFIPRSYYQFFR